MNLILSERRDFLRNIGIAGVAGKIFFFPSLFHFANRAKEVECEPNYCIYYLNKAIWPGQPRLPDPHATNATTRHRVIKKRKILSSGVNRLECCKKKKKKV